MSSNVQISILDGLMNRIRALEENMEELQSKYLDIHGSLIALQDDLNEWKKEVQLAFDGVWREINEMEGL